MARVRSSTESVGVVLDGTDEVRYFAPEELEITAAEALPPDREAAKQRRAAREFHRPRLS